MPSDRRHQRIQQFIQRTLGEIIQEEIYRADMLITITKVETSVDLQWADVSVSIFPYAKHEEMLALLKRKAGHFQTILNRALRIKHTPKIRFVLDFTLEAGIADGEEDDVMGQ
mgnify:CR=1 FL=1